MTCFEDCDAHRSDLAGGGHVSSPTVNNKQFRRGKQGQTAGHRLEGQYLLLTRIKVASLYRLLRKPRLISDSNPPELCFQEWPEIFLCAAEAEAADHSQENVAQEDVLKIGDNVEHQASAKSFDFKQMYNECFVSAFAEDLNSLREAETNSQLIRHVIEATSSAFKPSDWQTSL